MKATIKPPRPLTEHDVIFTLEHFPEEQAIEGNCSAIDPVTDRETERWIYGELERGNQWAWCVVKVTASWGSFHGIDYLGCCSYRSEEEFRKPGDYFDDMKAAALADLNATIERTANQIALLR
jgi:hypothetical protein